MNIQQNILDTASELIGIKESQLNVRSLNVCMSDFFTQAAAEFAL